MRTVRLVEEEAILSFLDEIIHSASFPINLVDSFSRDSIGEIDNNEFMVKNQLICFPNGTNTNPTVMLPRTCLVANGVEMFFPLTSFYLIPNLNKLFCHLRQADSRNWIFRLSSFAFRKSLVSPSKATRG